MTVINLEHRMQKHFQRRGKTKFEKNKLIKNI
jgi:hypothetical protein